MTTQSKSVAVTVDNRDATKEDARTLGRVYRQLVDASKIAKKALRDVSEGWIFPESLDALREHRDITQSSLDAVMDIAWAALTGMPNGVVAGQATPQTVGLQFFNRNLNRNLKARLTATEAKQINKLAFGC